MFVIMEKLEIKKPWYKKKLFIFGIIILSLIVINAIGNSDKKTNNSGVTVTNDGKRKEGDVISGIGRKELEDQYNEAKEKSKFKADEYLATLKGKEVEWIGKVENFDTNPVNSTPYVTVKMGIYSVLAYDKAKSYTNLEKGQLVTIKGKLDSFFELVGLSVYVDPTSIVVVPK